MAPVQGWDAQIEKSSKFFEFNIWFISWLYLEDCIWLVEAEFFCLENNIFCFLFEEKKSKEDYLELIIGCKSFGDMRDQLENLYHWREKIGFTYLILEPCNEWPGHLQIVILF